jgi:RNA polymerase subunit RPABC4/transcription elongation factor Spt4
MHCQNCGQFNAQQTNFCRFCGAKFSPVQNSAPPHTAPPPPPNFDPLQPKPAPQDFYESMQRRPYSWKTDEFQVSEDKKTKTENRVPPLANFQPPPHAAMQTFQQGPMLNQNFHCPRCGSSLYPVLTRQISTTGWVIFALLLVTTFFLFWIGLLIKEDVRVCPVCRFRYQ